MEEKLSSALPNMGAHPLGSLENPIRVKGINGEIDYLQRLFTLTRSPLFYHRLQGTMDENRDPLDIYELIAQDNSGHWLLAISRHHRTVSNEAPEGLWLGPKVSPKAFQEHPYRGTTIGVDKPVKNFPLGLPRGLRRAWMGADPLLPKFVESLLSKFTPEEWRNQPFQMLLTSNRRSKLPDSIAIARPGRRGRPFPYCCYGQDNPVLRPIIVEQDGDYSPIEQ